MLEEENYAYMPADFVRAASLGDELAVKNFLAAGMDVNAKDTDGQVALFSAAEKGYLPIVKILVENKAEVDIRNRDGWTPLMLAAYNNRSSVVEYLLSQKADPEKKDNSGWTALMQAVYKGHAESVGVLAPLNKDSLDRGLLVAALMGHGNVIRVLLDQGADINARTENGETPLMLAAQKHRVDVAQILLASGADKSIQDVSGKTAEAIALERGHHDLAAIIAEAVIIEAKAQSTPPSATPGTTPVEAGEGVAGTGQETDATTGVAPSDVNQGPPAVTQEPLAQNNTETGTPPAATPATEATPAGNQDESAAIAMGEAWFKKYGLDISDPSVLDQDPDGDGYTNREEFLADTDPTDPDSSPRVGGQLTMVEYKEETLPYVLEGISNGRAKIRKKTSGEIIYLNEGESLPGYSLKVERVQSRGISEKDTGRTFDVSEVTLRDPATGGTTLLVSGMEARSPNSTALLAVGDSGQTIQVKRNEEFKMPGTGVAFQVTEIRPDQVILREVESGRMHTVKKVEN